MLKKKTFKWIRIIVFIILILIVAGLYTYSYFHRREIKLIEEQRKEPLGIGFLSNDSKIKFNQKTPRNLFATFGHALLLKMCGEEVYSVKSLNCISPVHIDASDSKILRRTYDLQEDELAKFSVAFSLTDFNAEDIPDSAPGNTFEITLGEEWRKQTFYLAKRKDGDWYFTEKNFTNPQTIKKWKYFLKKREKISFEIKDLSTPLLAYTGFVLGFQEKYGLNFENSRKAMELDWIPKTIRANYSRVLAFALFKVLETENININSVKGLPGHDGVENTELMYMCSNPRANIYLKRHILDDTGKTGWWFNRKVLNNALKIFKATKMKSNTKDPFWFTLMQFQRKYMPFLEKRIFDRTYLVWIILIFSIIALYYVFSISYRLIKYILSYLSFGKTILNYNKITRNFSLSSALLLTLHANKLLVNYALIFHMRAYYYYINFLTISLSVLFIWWFCEIVNLICQVIGYILKQRSRTKFQIAFAVEIIKRLASIVIIITGTGFLVQRLGINIVNFLTALGIGGLAVALAGKDTIENVFGSIMIALEQPFKIGDWVIIGDVEGTVEHVGLRSTRIRTFEDSFLTIPNVVFITSKVNNMGERTYRRYTTSLELDNSTSPGLLKAFTRGIDELIQKTPSMKKEGYHIRVNDFSDSSIKVLIYVFFVAIDWDKELEEREEFILNVMRLSDKLGIKRAFPSQTLYLTKHKELESKNTLDLTPKQLSEKTMQTKSIAGKIAEKFIGKPTKEQ